MCLASVKLPTLVDDHLLQLPLARGPLKYFLVDGVGRDQAIHHHWFGLTDAVAAVLSLQVCLGVLGRKQNSRFLKHIFNRTRTAGAAGTC